MSTKISTEHSADKSNFSAAFAAAIATIALSLTVFAAGCGSEIESSVSSSNNSNDAGAAVNNQANLAMRGPIANSPLVGTWWGSGAIDEAAISEVFAALSPAGQEQLAVQAENFLATEMAIEFRPDATMETAIEIRSDGENREAGDSTARWTAKQIDQNRFEVTATEIAADGTETTSSNVWQLSEDGNQISLIVAMPGTLLEECGTSIILDRHVDVAPQVADETDPLSKVR